MITPDTREYRSFPVEVRQEDNEHAAGWIHGRAVVFNSPDVMYTDPETGIEYTEEIDAHAFDECDMSDVIMQYDHAGKVLARTSNGSLVVGVDDVGLFFAADLGRTEAARSLYEDVKAGMVTKMSWRFRVGDYYYDRENRTIVHTRIAKVYDVAPVSIPANDSTDINARAWVDGEIAQAARSEAELNERRRKLRVKINTATGGI